MFQMLFTSLLYYTGVIIQFAADGQWERKNLCSSSHHRTQLMAPLSVPRALMDPVGKSLTFRVSGSKCFLQALTQQIFKWERQKKKNFFFKHLTVTHLPFPRRKRGKEKEGRE